METSAWPRVVVMLCSLAPGACTTDTVDDTDTGEPGETGGDDGVCEFEDPYVCTCFIWDQWKAGGIVYGSYSAAAQACFNSCFETHGGADDTKLTPIACAEVPRMLDCAGWEPERAVDFNAASGAYLVPRTFVEALTVDPEPLRACDDAVLMAVSSGGYMVADADPGELLYALGLRSGDVLLAINGYPLDTPTQVALAFTELWSGGEVGFALELRRGARLLDLSYELTGP